MFLRGRLGMMGLRPLVVAAVITAGCSPSEAPTQVASSSGPIVRQSQDDPDMNCLVKLRDGTNLQLYRAESAKHSPSVQYITVRHRIDLDAKTGESLDHAQQPLLSLSYSDDNGREWTKFDGPQEKGEMSFYMFYFGGQISTRDLSQRIRFKIQQEDATYEVEGPRLSEFAVIPQDYWQP